jgi:hypothetical protein
MRRIAVFLAAVAALAGMVGYTAAPASGQADGDAAPIYGITIPPGYRDWKLISVAREEGNLNDIRAQLGNEIAMKAYLVSVRLAAVLSRWRHTTWILSYSGESRLPHTCRTKVSVDWLGPDSGAAT